MTNKTPEQLYVAENNPEFELSRIDTTIQMLRGRWVLVTILALIGSIFGGVLGFTLPKPVYRSEGFIEIKPNIPKILSSDESKNLLNEFEGYMSQQKAMLNSKDFQRKAMLRNEWQAIHPGNANGLFVKFERNAEAQHKFKSHVIELYFSDTDPVAAKIGVEVLAKTYIDEIERQENEDQNEVQKLVIKEYNRLTNELNLIRHKIAMATHKVGGDSLKTIYVQKVRRLDLLEQELDQVSMTLESMDEVYANATEKMTLQMVASHDYDLRRLLRDAYLIDREMKRLAVNYGYRHIVMRQKRLVLSNIKDQINIYIHEVGDQYSSNGNAEIIRLRAQKKSLERLVKNVNLELVSIGRQELELSQFRDKEKEIASKVNMVQVRVDEMAVNAEVSGRAKVLSYGNEPASAYSDRRNLGLVAGVLFGGMMGFGIVLFIAWLDPSIRNMDDLELAVQEVARLGVLPQLPDDMNDDESKAIAAHCVHSIRTKIQISAVRDNNHVFAVTSSSPASGKSNLVMALGISFSGTGGRTLMIDCDLVGAGLSHRIAANVPAQNRSPLVKAGLINNAQLNKARVKSQEEGRYLVEVLVESGDLMARDADRASKLLETGNRGLLNVIQGDNIEDCVLETDTPNLFVLTVGDATEADIRRLSLTGMQRVFDAAREKFDNVLVDTGPTPGSTEAALATAAADGTVIVVARGEDRQEVLRATQELKHNNVHILGVVYNRADETDMELAGATSMSRRSQRPTTHASLMIDDDLASSRTGSLSHSVSKDS